MKRLFGSKKKKEVVAPPPQKDPFDFDKHQEKVDQRINKGNQEIQQLEGQIRQYYTKLKQTALASEKNYIKQRLKQLLMRRKHLENQLNRQYNQQMMVDQVKFNKEMIDDNIQMGKHIKEANQVQQQALKDFDIDAFQDNMDDMRDLAYENEDIARLMNEQFEVDVDDDLDAELENLENELQVQEMMKVENTNNVQLQKNM